MVKKVDDTHLQSLEKNKYIAHRFHMEIISERNLDLADKIIAPDCVFHTSGGTMPVKGPEGARNISDYDAAHFDENGVAFDHDVVLAEGDLVAFHWINTGTSKETGEAERFEGLDMVRLKDNQIVELWIEYHKVEGQ